MSGRQRDFLARVVAEMEHDPSHVPGPRELARALGTPPQAIEEILRLGVAAGELIQLADDICMTSARIQCHADHLRTATAPRPFTPAEAREILGMTRRIANPLLDHFDASGMTARESGRRHFRS